MCYCRQKHPGAVQISFRLTRAGAAQAMVDRCAQVWQQNPCTGTAQALVNVYADTSKRSTIADRCNTCSWYSQIRSSLALMPIYRCSTGSSKQRRL
jgi:hypothetical protein